MLRSGRPVCGSSVTHSLVCFEYYREVSKIASSISHEWITSESKLQFTRRRRIGLGGVWSAEWPGEANPAVGVRFRRPRGRGDAPPRRHSPPGLRLCVRHSPEIGLAGLHYPINFLKAPFRGVHAERNAQFAQPTIAIESVAAAGPAAGPGLSHNLPGDRIGWCVVG